jgi:tetratricopeptide (TPR) repeat protein
MKFRQANRLALLFLAFCLEISPIFAQDKFRTKEAFTEAESYFLYEEFADALPLYIRLKDQFPDNYNLSYRIGRCYLSLPYEKQKSIDYLKDAVKHNSGKSKVNSLKEVNAPSDALFYLGDAYRINNQLTEAIRAYRDFKEQANPEIYDIPLLDHEIKACEHAMVMEKRPVNVTMVNIGGIINTRFSETNPVVTPNETMIVYATKLPFYQAMFYSKKENGKWTEPVNMIPELGIDGDCFPTSISPDGTELYLYRSNEYLGDLYVTNYKSGKWTKIRKLNNNINTKYWESHACISPDGRTLYFTSNRKGGFGGLDIYKSTRLSTSTDDWGPAINLGPVVNSQYNEETPFITADGKRLYFSSFGHESMGGYDIFYSDLKDDGTWGEPVNLGYPVNSTDDEIFFNPLKDGSVAYMAKFDPDGFGRSDIYRYEIHLVPRKSLITGSVKVPQSILSEVYMALFDKVKKDTVLHMTTSNGSFSFEVDPGNYGLYLSCKGCETKVIALSIPKGSIEKTVGAVMQPSVNSVVPASTLAANIEATAPKSDISKETQTAENKPPEKENNKTTGPNVVQKDTSAALPLPQTSSGSIKKSTKPNASGSAKSESLRYFLAFGTVALFLLLFIILKRRRQKEKVS